MGTGAFGWRPAAAPIAFGPCLLTSAEDYARVGGHDAVRAEILEDVHLARRYRDAGLAVSCFAGGPLVRSRPYPGGPRQMVDGWSRNLAAGAVSASPLAVAGTVVWVASHVTVTLRLAAALHRWLRRRDPAPAAPLLAFVAVAAHQRWLLRRIGSFRRWTAFAFPVPLLGFLAIFCPVGGPAGPSARHRLARTTRRGPPVGLTVEGGSGVRGDVRQVHVMGLRRQVGDELLGERRPDR